MFMCVSMCECVCVHRHVYVCEWVCASVNVVTKQKVKWSKSA